MDLPHLQPSERLILLALSRRQLVSMDHILFALYGNRMDGGPDDPAGSFRVMLTRLRKKLAPMGITIEVAARGYHSPSYYAIRGVELSAIRRAFAERYGPEILKAA
jgi:hypothetical protein